MISSDRESLPTSFPANLESDIKSLFGSPILSLTSAPDPILVHSPRSVKEHDDGLMAWGSDDGLTA